MTNELYEQCHFTPKLNLFDLFDDEQNHQCTITIHNKLFLVL